MPHSSDIASQLSATIISDPPVAEDETQLGAGDKPQNKPGRAPSRELLQDFILESLSFQSMESREQDVAKAHGNSFDWIFNSTSSRDSANDPKFTEWLSTDNLGSIYWSGCHLS